MPRPLPLLALALAAAGCSGAEAPPPPSVILISLDTLRADRLGSMGYERETSPHLDALARESMLFERAIATSCWTLTAHMGMLTGLYPEQHGVIASDRALNPAVPTLAERLRALGYATYALYEPGWIDARHGFDRGFDVFRPHADAREAAAHLDALVPDLPTRRPFFLFVHLFDVHCDPSLGRPGVFYDPPPPYDRMFRPDAPEALAGIDFVQALAEPGTLTQDQLDALGAIYDGGVRYVDDLVGGWIEGWRERGLLDRAVLIVTADHGEALGLRDGELDNHGGMFQDALHVPLIVRLPDGRGAGERVEHAVGQVDLAPTILALAGAPADPHLPGYSLLSPPPPERVMPALLGEEYALVSWPWKVRGGPGGRVLHQLEEDPGEKRPLSLADPRAAAAHAEMEAAFRRERERLVPYPVQAIPAGELDEASRARLRAIGYADELDAR